MKARKSPVRLMDARFCFQTALDADEHYRQFYVRVSRSKGQDVVTIDICGDGDGGMIEGIDPTFLDQVKEGLEVVLRVKLPALSEQER